MSTSPDARPSRLLRESRRRLSEWQRRIDSVEQYRAELDADARIAAAPFLQELRDRLETAKLSVQRLEQLERASSYAESSTSRSLTDLGEIWRVVEKHLMPKGECRRARDPTVPRDPPPRRRVHPGNDRPRHSSTTREARDNR